MVLLVMIITFTGTAVFLTYLLEFALATRRDPLSVRHTGNAAMRRARRTAGMYVRRSEGTDFAKPVDIERAPVA
jgi:hypothetical protein